ncbi:putative phosphatase [Oligella ureolytica]
MKLNSVAFFDVDETLIHEKSMFSVLAQLELRDLEIKNRKIQQKIIELSEKNTKREEINKYFYSCFKNVSQSLVREVAQAYFEEKILSETLFKLPVLSILLGLQSIGVKIALLSGSSEDFLQPIGNQLKVDFILATQQETDTTGSYTGNILNLFPMIGEGKTRTVESFMKKHSLNPNKCFGFGDHHSDAGFLSIVGTPVVIGGNETMESFASEHNWPIIK